ncbi:tetratricopeptide repeat protein, partial [Candidatus Collierbacteria bacterium]|nr:tetratricopeptide repeat protein [Candidatus Collierbacteria bacterium]
IGSGPETFFSVYTRLKPASLNLTNLWNIRFTNSSNEALELLATVGLLCAFLWITAITKPRKLALNQIKLKKDVSPQLTASFLFTAGTFIAMFLIPASVVLFTAFFLGLILLNLALSTDIKVGKDIDINLSGVTPSLLPLATLLVSLVGLAVFWSNAGKTYAASLISFKAGQLLKTNTTESYNLQIKAFQLDPKTSAYRINFSQTSMALANQIAKQKDLSDEDKKNVSQLVQQAIREAKNATDLDPTNVVAWENLSGIYQQITGFVEGAPDWTVASYSQAISLDPSNPALRLGLGGFFFGLGDYEQAIKIFEQAVNLKPNWANAHYNLSTAYKAKKDYAKALNEMKIVAQLLDPKSEDVKKVEEEVKELEKLAPTPTPTPTPAPSN